MTGKIRWMDGQKGYGFIMSETKPNIFFHYSQVTDGNFRSLKKGEEVEFDLYEAPKGYEARSVKKKS